MTQSINELTAFWPCDKCGQRSQEAWRHESRDLVLTLCGHDSRANEVALASQGWVLIMVAPQAKA